MSSIPNPATTDWVPLWGAQNVAPSKDVRVYRNITQSIPSAVWAAVSFNSVRYDNGGHWSAGSPTRLTCQQAGTYVITGSVCMAIAAGGSYRLAAVYWNGSTNLSINGPSAVTVGGTSPPYISVTAVAKLNVGDWVELMLYQDSGAAMTLPAGDSGGGQYNCDLSMVIAGGPQGLPGMNGANGVGVPTPVVNSQFIKGSGGAAIWSPIIQGDLPGNLGATGIGLTGSDYNSTVAAGWYVGVPSDAHGPGPYYCHVQVYQFGGPQVKQVAHRYDALQTFERVYIGGVGWGAWTQQASRGSAYPNIFTGPWYNYIPGPGSGVPFSISVPGNYSALIGVSAYAITQGNMVMVYVLDGVQQAAGSQLYANENASHKMMCPAVISMPNLSAGTHYIAPVLSSNVVSGADDYGFLIVFPTV